MAESIFARKLVIDRMYYELPNLEPGTYIRTSGGDGVELYDPKNKKTYPYSGLRLTDQETRFYLTYFDQIDVPCVPEIDYFDSDLEFLQSVGFLVRSTYPLQDDGYYIWPVDEFLPDFGYAPDWAIRDRTASEPGIWSLALRGRTYEPQEIIPNKAIEIGMYSCLPVPAENTAFSDILEFKERYAAELDRLRMDIYGLYEKVIQSRDPELALHAAKASLQQGLRNLTKAMKGRSIGTKLISLKTQFSLQDFGKISAATGALVAAGIPLELAIAGGIAAGVLQVHIGGRPNSIPMDRTPIDFAYLAKMSSEFRIA